MIRGIHSLFLAFFLFPLPSSGQVCISFAAMGKEEGVSVSQLDSLYAGKDSGKLARGEEQVFLPKGTEKVYRRFVRGLGQYLADQEGVEWDATVRYYQRIYFEADGSAAYYLYQFKRNGFNGPSRDRFERAVERYLAENKLEVDKDERFALCAPVVLRPPKDQGE